MSSSPQSPNNMNGVEPISSPTTTTSNQPPTPQNWKFKPQTPTDFSNNMGRRRRRNSEPGIVVQKSTYKNFVTHWKLDAKKPPKANANSPSTTGNTGKQQPQQQSQLPQQQQQPLTQQQQQQKISNLAPSVNKQQQQQQQQQQQAKQQSLSPSAAIPPTFPSPSSAFTSIKSPNGLPAPYKMPQQHHHPQHHDDLGDYHYGNYHHHLPPPPTQSHQSYQHLRKNSLGDDSSYKFHPYGSNKHQNIDMNCINNNNSSNNMPSDIIEEHLANEPLPSHYSRLSHRRVSLPNLTNKSHTYSPERSLSPIHERSLHGHDQTFNQLYQNPSSLQNGLYLPQPKFNHDFIHSSSKHISSQQSSSSSSSSSQSIYSSSPSSYSSSPTTSSMHHHHDKKFQPLQHPISRSSTLDAPLSPTEIISNTSTSSGGGSGGVVNDNFINTFNQLKSSSSGRLPSIQALLNDVESVSITENNNNNNSNNNVYQIESYHSQPTRTNSKENIHYQQQQQHQQQQPKQSNSNPSSPNLRNPPISQTSPATKMSVMNLLDVLNFGIISVITHQLEKKERLRDQV
ncbi:hypothetical protein PPL_03958 [Heterostelium album PN500]|uniref:Uncharacterized protein n=1 Tax=Heterostelium pallidum (strain ATCC 26659 / Pp 5 / PN500) TaxID=670386 RepID=D3B5M0_HETP5|nr:hypothetical protein PPL_03958 [Heterostelium album PN500]EFA83168.1 hypothetical protein PPL_03958 [Heterostelium album PN500]|eukprot:XP_020435285.1 hypothetical protein PPL_03958 [Heterostelium album PN500]